MITLDLIEQGVTHQSMAQMLSFEHGRADYRSPDDRTVCEMIDRDLLADIGKESIYLLSRSEKVELANRLCRDFGLSKAQVARCLAMNY